MAMNSVESTDDYRIAAFIFTDRNRARVIGDEVKAAGTFETYQVVSHAVIEVDDKGKPHLHEAGRGALGAILGAASGGVLGLVAGPPGVLAGAAAGAIVGGVAGHSAGRLIPAEEMKLLATHMQPDSSALLALVQETLTEALVAALASYEARVVVLTVSEDVSGDLHVATALPGESLAIVDAGPGEMYHATALPGQKTT